MKRALVFGSFLVLAGCTFDLDDYPRAFSCDRTGGDGGQQCAQGWSCGYDNRCFRRRLVDDGGLQGVDGWQCESDVQCPNDWRCGQEVDGERHCQKVGFGAAWACTDNTGCEADWRCAGTQRCFDPSDVDGGTTRTCSTDSMCPNGFRCGQDVPDRERLCLRVDAGAPASCLDDLGCEGGWRCDRFQSRCVLVTDVVSTANTTSLGVERISPRALEAAPLRFAMTPLCPVPWSFDRPDAGFAPGVMWASLFSDGGVRVTSQLRDEVRRPDGGFQLLFERTFALPPGVAARDVAELAAASEGVGVRLQNGRAFKLPLGFGVTSWVPARPDGGTATLLRQRDARHDADQGALIVVSGSELRVDQLVNVTPEPIHEVSMTTFNEGYVFTPDGGFGLSLTGPIAFPQMSGLSLRTPSLGVSAGRLSNPSGDPFDVTLSEVALDGGAIGFTAAISMNANGVTRWVQLAPSLACPDGSPPQQLTVADDGDGRPAALARCKTPGGLPYPVSIPLLSNPLKYESTEEDGTPFAGAVVSQKTGPFVRAHAAENGKVWHALPPTPTTIYDEARADWTLRAVVLDRQPTALVSFFETNLNAARVFASAGDRNFSGDVNGGLVSSLRSGGLRPLSVVQGSPNVLVASEGLVLTGGLEARVIARVTGLDRLQPPASAALGQLMLDGALRSVVLVASSDSVWAADITDALASPFAQPATIARVLVPVPGVQLRSLTLQPAASGLSGYVTTNSRNLRFTTADVVRWSLTDVPTPVTDTLPLAVWSEPDGGSARTGFSDGRVWSLPVMVELTRPLVGSDGGALGADDYARKCGDVFAATREGVFRLEASADGGLPGWAPLAEVNRALDSTTSLRLYETHDSADRLFVGTRSGLVLEVTGACR